mgnify:CR=1 FL=1
MEKYLLLMLGAIFVNNFVLTRFLGICPFLGVSKQLSTALGMCAALIFVMTSASAVMWLIARWFLSADGVFGVDRMYLQTIVFILVIAAFVQFVELVIRKSSPGLYKALGIYLPLITTNCAVLGVALINVQKGYNFGEATAFGFSAAAGFSLALIIFTGLREKMDRANPPAAFRGTALALVTAGLLSLAFFGFAGLVKM